MTSNQTKYVAYYRVSTQKQGQSGLGLQAQREGVRTFTRCELQGDRIIGEFTEVESGKNNQRTQLLRAIELAKEKGATLVIAKLDRLSRNAGFIFALRDSGVNFVCADMPDANTLTVGIFAVLAQHERELISKRTRDALAAKKARGEKLGTPSNLTSMARLKGERVRMEAALTKKENRQATHIILSARGQGKSYRVIAHELNSLGFKTSTGKRFDPTTVRRLYVRAGRT